VVFFKSDTRLSIIPAFILSPIPRISIKRCIRASHERLPLLVKINSVFSVINTGYEIVFKALYATKLLKTLAHRHFKNVVCFLNLADVNFLKLNKFLV
jgi:hypothetical protein